MTVEDTNRSNVKFSVQVIKLEEEIVHFDSILERIQELMPEDLRVYEAVVEARDRIFRMREMMRGCEIVKFCDDGGAEELRQ